MNALKLLTIVIGSIAPLMYFHGQAFHAGWLSYWSLPSDLFQLPLEQVLINGYISYTLIGIPLIFLIFVCLLVAVGALYNIHEITKIKWLKKLYFTRLEKLEKNEKIKGSFIVEKALNVTWKMMLLSLFLFLFLFLAVKVSEQASELGRKSAQQKHQKLSKTHLAPTIKIGNETIHGEIIICGNLFCGVLSNNSVMLLPVKSIGSVGWGAPHKSSNTDGDKASGREMTERNEIRS